jgi:hypothetical protein
MEPARFVCMEQCKENTNQTDWRYLLFFLPQAIVVGLITVYAGGWIGESWSPWLAYPAAFVIGVVLAIIGTAVFGDSPTTFVEMGCGGVILCVMVAIMLPVFAQARQKARERAHKTAIPAKASPIPGAAPSEK